MSDAASEAVVDPRVDLERAIRDYHKRIGLRITGYQVPVYRSAFGGTPCEYFGKTAAEVFQTHVFHAQALHLTAAHFDKAGR